MGWPLLISMAPPTGRRLQGLSRAWTDATEITMESTTAILLRKRKLSDTSLIVSWCTDSLGCSRKSNLHTLTEVALRNPFGGIRKNHLRTQAAAYFVELVEICTESDHHEPEMFALLRRAFAFLDTNDPTRRAVSHFEAELARITGVHDRKMLKSDPAFALANLFGKLPRSRSELLKALNVLT